MVNGLHYHRRHVLLQKLTLNMLKAVKVLKFQKNILNNISYALHILVITADVNGLQFTKFSFQFIWH